MSQICMWSESRSWIQELLIFCLHPGPPFLESGLERFVVTVAVWSSGGLWKSLKRRQYPHAGVKWRSSGRRRVGQSLIGRNREGFPPALPLPFWYNCNVYWLQLVQNAIKSAKLTLMHGLNVEASLAFLPWDDAIRWSVNKTRKAGHTLVKRKKAREPTHPTFEVYRWTALNADRLHAWHGRQSVSLSLPPLLLHIV